MNLISVPTAHNIYVLCGGRKNQGHHHTLYSGHIYNLLPSYRIISQTSRRFTMNNITVVLRYISDVLSDMISVMRSNTTANTVET